MELIQVQNTREIPDNVRFYLLDDNHSIEDGAVWFERFYGYKPLNCYQFDKYGVYFEKREGEKK